MFKTMVKSLYFAVAVAGIVISNTTSSLAVDSTGNYRVLLTGTFTCSRYTGIIENQNVIKPPINKNFAPPAIYTNDFILIEGYIQGWLSAYNLIVADTYSIAVAEDIEPVRKWLKPHCQANPNDTLDVALQRFAAQAYPNRLKARP